MVLGATQNHPPQNPQKNELGPNVNPSTSLSNNQNSININPFWKLFRHDSSLILLKSIHPFFRNFSVAQTRSYDPIHGRGIGAL